MAKIGLIDVDGHRFPNLALMRISAYHKAKGDTVEWWWSDLVHYDVVYMSKIFSSAYSIDIPEPINADTVIKGGTGYCISLGADGKEHFDKSKNTSLCDDVERCFPDYSIYPQFDFAVSMTSRGCPRGCAFCHVASKEGKCATKVANVSDFWASQKEIKVLDPNITACAQKRDLLGQYRKTGAWIDFTQGIDIRLVNEQDIDDLNHMKIKMLHFAWDNPCIDLSDKFKAFQDKTVLKDHRRKTVYCLTNFEDVSPEEHIERALMRVYKLRELGYTPYIMIYNKPNASEKILDLQRWANNKQLFYSMSRFEEYDKYARRKINRLHMEENYTLEGI